MKEIHEMQGAGRSIGGSPGRPWESPEHLWTIPPAFAGAGFELAGGHAADPRSRRASKLQPPHRVRWTVDVRGAGKLRGTAQGGQGGRPCRWCSIPESCVSLRRRGRQRGAGMRFETAWEQAEVDWGRQTCIDRDGRKRRIRVFVLGVRSGCSFWVFVLGVRSGCSFWMFVLGVRDNVPGLVPDLIRELECQAAAYAALNPDARNIPGTEDRPALSRNMPQSPGERSERGFSPITTPGGPEMGGNAAVGIRGAAPARLSTATLPPPPEILGSAQRSGTGEGVE